MLRHFAITSLLATLALAPAVRAQPAPATATASQKSSDLPAPIPYAFKLANGIQPGLVSAGSPAGALKLPAPAQTRGGATIALLGNMAPPFADAVTSEKRAGDALRQLNLLRPDLAFSLGNLVPGFTRSPNTFAAEILAQRERFNTLDMPWFPCAGETDILPGTGLPDDRRFEALYQKYQGPLYYSVDTGDLHVIVLDSEEGPNTSIGDAQIKWLKSDLNRVFEGTLPGKRARWVVVLVHRAMWRDPNPGTWKTVHQMLVDLNKRPVVSVEGVSGSSGKEARGPSVVAVIAAGPGYSKEPSLDGIRYTMLGPCAAATSANEDDADAGRGILLLKFEPEVGSGDGLHAALVNLGETGANRPAILPDDVIAAHERDAVDTIASWGNDNMGVDGCIDLRDSAEPNPAEKLHLHMKNKLKDPIDITLRLASARNIVGTAHISANPTAEGLDLPWELTSPHTIRHLDAGASDSWDIGFAHPADATNSPDPTPPQLEFVIHWRDGRAGPDDTGRGHIHEVILKRRIPLAARIQVPLAKSFNPAGAWDSPMHSAFAWQLPGDQPRKVNPAWQIAADGASVCVRIRVDDSTHSYQPALDLNWSRGGLPVDAVNVAWTPDAKSPVRRIWAVPFAPDGVELWTNGGTGDKQTPLTRLDEKSGAKAAVTVTAGGYEVTVIMPRDMVFGPLKVPAPATASSPVVLASVLANISVTDNDEGLMSATRSWSSESAGVESWGKIEIITTPPPPATATAPAAATTATTAPTTAAPASTPATASTQATTPAPVSTPATTQDNLNQ